MDEKKLEVAVVTTSGRWPKDKDVFDPVADTEKVRKVLDEAAKALKLTGTSDWIAVVAGTTNPLNQDVSFKENGVTHGKVTLDYGPRHGGGGRRA